MYREGAHSSCKDHFSKHYTYTTDEARTPLLLISWKACAFFSSLIFYQHTRRGVFSFTTEVGKNLIFLGLVDFGLRDSTTSLTYLSSVSNDRLFIPSLFGSLRYT